MKAKDQDQGVSLVGFFCSLFPWLRDSNFLPGCPMVPSNLLLGQPQQSNKSLFTLLPLSKPFKLVSEVKGFCQIPLGCCFFFFCEAIHFILLNPYHNSVNSHLLPFCRSPILKMMFRTKEVFPLYYKQKAMKTAL